MVFFVCEGCNETLRKNKVDTHASRCRQCWAVSCVDCSAVFEGDDYREHTTCVSEAEKYERSLYKGKDKSKNMTAQEKWMKVVREAKADGNNHLQSLLDRIAEQDNVPRKKSKFVNFAKNSIRIQSEADVMKIWELYEGLFNTLNSNNSTEEKSLKRSAEEETPEQEPIKRQKTTDTQEKVDWKELIRATLKYQSSKSLSLKELRQEVNARSATLQPKDSQMLETDKLLELVDADDNISTKKMIARTKMKSTDENVDEEGRKYIKSARKVLKKAPEHRMKKKELCKAILSKLEKKDAVTDRKATKKAIQRTLDATLESVLIVQYNP